MRDFSFVGHNLRGETFGEEGVNLILEKNETVVPFASKSIDLTDRVIKVYDLQKK